ncbi:MAG: hypothetical protein ACREID_03235, partial [Planctomycetota bacterium]
MAARRRGPGGKLLGAIVLLLLLAALLPLSGYVAGILPGGGRRPAQGAAARAASFAGGFKVTVLRAEDSSPVEGATIVVRGLAGGEAGAVSDAAGEAT